MPYCPNKFDYKEIIYEKDHWLLLAKLREKAKKIMVLLEKSNLKAIVHGSVARGDINQFSDIDIFFPGIFSSFKIESILKKYQIKIKDKYLIQATPNSSMKAYIEINDQITLSFSLMKLRKVEREFYSFGGIINLKQINSNYRSNGINKNLMLIEPTPSGHTELNIKGIEDHAAKTIGISTQTVLNRTRTLNKRIKIGRTGVFIKRKLELDQPFEMILNQISKKNSAVKRRLREDYSG